ncbi:MAG: dihydroneopterin aldolase [Bacteroidales bacterium]|nr:dihydroneopterin aldolase [Bacteroidales bacterium]
MDRQSNMIFIEDMEFFAFHGHYDEEKFAGNRFTVSIYLYTDTSKAEKSDNLDDALNYQVVYAIICYIMRNTKSNLVENLASNILDALFARFTQLQKARIRIAKLNPPMGGKIGKVGVEIEHER